MLNEEQLKKVFEEMAFSKAEIDVLVDETKIDEHGATLEGWHKRYSDTVAKEPAVKKFYEDQFKDEGFNKSKEAIRKARKKINTDLSLGLSAKEMDEMTDDEFSIKVKDHSAKDTDTKLKDITLQYEEEKRLREELELNSDKKIKEIELDFKNKGIKQTLAIQKAELLALKDGAKFNKSNPKLIDNAIKGAEIEQNITWVEEDDKIFKTVNGVKERDKSNNFIEYKTWLDLELSPFEIKGRETPKIDPTTGKPIEEKVVELDQNSKDLMKIYKDKGIKTGLEEVAV